jgi:dihydrofolate synthase/folylpolyglutamate synthase
MSKLIESWLETNIGFENAKLGLERINEAIKVFNLKSNAKIITIAGTNGKGSVSRLIAGSLSKTNSTGLFTSPHLESICERFKFNDQLIDEDYLFSKMKVVFSDLNQRSLELSFFEFLFFIFYIISIEKECEYLVLEVGLGGRFDATNSVDADISVVTSIGRDHQDYLGKTYKKILNEKIQITRVDKPLVCSFELEYLKQLSRDHQKQIGFKILDVYNSELNFKQQNSLIAKKVCETLGLAYVAVQLDDIVSFNGSTLHFYGSHNLPAVRKLVQYLKQNDYNNAFDTIFLSFSKRDKKEINQMITLYRLLGGEIILSSADHFKSMDPIEMKKLAKENGFKFADMDNIFLSSFKTNVLVSGSNYFIGEFKRAFSKECKSSF